ncbi:MAG: hypothetical protein SNG38_05545 [Rikenellaceae bacterium]
MPLNRNLLVGNWEFVETEKYDGSKWIQADHVENMTWEFNPQYFGVTKVIGNITEQTPSESPTTLNYIFNIFTRQLIIEVHTDPKTKILNEVDIYEVVDVTESSDQITVTLSLTNQLDCPTPYLRYKLCKTL